MDLRAATVRGAEKSGRVCRSGPGSFNAFSEARHEAELEQRRSENDVPPDPKLVAKMGALIDEMTKAGVLQAAGGLASTKKGARIRFEGGKRTVIDGPFAESKELVAGYAILDLPSKAAAIEWATRFGEVVKVSEIDVRQLAE